MERMARTRPALLLLVLLALASQGCQVDVPGAEPVEAQETKAPAQSEPALVILNDTDLPDTFPHAAYDLQFRARGGVPTHHWRVEKGALPPGIVLDDGGNLHGQAERAGEFQFTVSVRDGSQPQQAVQKGFTLRVKSALTLTWKTVAHVNGNRIEGSVEVTNVTPNDMDLTFIALAVPANGRATAIGYQHFVLRRTTVAMELPFGETLPNGSYVVHVDAVGEVAAKNLIYRDRMQTPSPLQVTVGP